MRRDRFTPRSSTRVTIVSWSRPSDQGIDVEAEETATSYLARSAGPFDRIAIKSDHERLALLLGEE